VINEDAAFLVPVDAVTHSGGGAEDVRCFATLIVRKGEVKYVTPVD
jgi:hypothetical protein